jgi:hypothetical protein
MSNVRSLGSDWVIQRPDVKEQHWNNDTHGDDVERQSRTA